MPGLTTAPQAVVCRPPSFRLHGPATRLHALRRPPARRCRPQRMRRHRCRIATTLGRRRRRNEQRRHRRRKRVPAAQRRSQHPAPPRSRGRGHGSILRERSAARRAGRRRREHPDGRRRRRPAPGVARRRAGARPARGNAGPRHGWAAVPPWWAGRGRAARESFPFSARENAGSLRSLPARPAERRTERPSRFAAARFSRGSGPDGSGTTRRSRADLPPGRSAAAIPSREGGTRRAACAGRRRAGSRRSAAPQGSR